jgi:3-oxo-5alpha-steroid 4-dehydrogenase
VDPSPPRRDAGFPALLRARDVRELDAETDVAVVGMGCAGVCAALGAREAGAEVIALERAGGPGGTSANSGGLLYLGGGTALQRACGFEDSAEAMYAYLMASCGSGADPALIAPYCEESAAHFDWLTRLGLPFRASFFPDSHEPDVDHGLTYSGSEEVHPFCELARPAPRGHRPRQNLNAGSLLMRVLADAAQKAGANAIPNLLCEALIAEDDGRVVGVAGIRLGRRFAVRARRGVVLAAGGFILDRAMVARHEPRLLACRHRVATDGDDGRGIRMGLAAGAEALHMDAADITLALFPPIGLKRGIYVNRQGQRFLNEDAYMGRAGEHALLHQDGRVWLIVDDAIYARPQHFELAVAAVADSVADLERELGLPESALQETIAFYNRHAARGQDPLFHKRPAFLKPLAVPPFAALDLSPERAMYSVFTLGGLHIDAGGGVVSPRGDRIPGLFAAGRTTSGISKGGYSSGLSLGDGTFFGRRAGASAAGRAR